MNDDWQKQQEEMFELKQKLDKLEAISRSVMTREAFQRYSTLKLVHPEKAVRLLILIGQLVQTNRIMKIGDAELKLLLEKMDAQKDAKIKFV